MEVYPSSFVAHNVPLVLLSGLGLQPPHGHEQDPYPLLEEKGTKISSELPPVTGPSAEELLGIFLEHDAQDAAWNGRPGRGKMGTMGFKIKAAGKGYVLPPRKADPSPSPTLLPVAQNTTRSLSQPPVSHSPLSPLTPGSPTFPGGILTPLWILKHQTLLPSAFVAFFSFTSDPDLSTLHDTQLKTEINAMRSSITASSYKIRLVVVLVSEPHDFDAGIDDRLANIRKATGLDPKNSMFFLPPNFSTVELRGFVGTILSAIYPSCIEYYRDLSKQARRKKNRGAPPPSTAGTSQMPSNQGWNVRYDFKLGVFAEFRQEMDAAGRSFEEAYQGLFSDDMFGSIASPDSRFNEYWLLADVLAIRILRCLLWNGQTTAAVQSWSSHRSRIQDVVDRKGKGFKDGQWEAWEANWSSIMAETIERAELPIFAIPEQPRVPDVQSTKPIAIYASLDKAIERGERFLPWDVLHHEGYWFNRSVRHTRMQRRLASVSKEDHYDPEHSPAPQVWLSGAATEESDPSQLLVDTLRKSAHQFAKRHQVRAVERLELDIARELAQSGHWNDAILLLKPLWQRLSWRQAGWWHLVGEVAWLLRESAHHTGDAEILLSVEWELMSKALKPRPGWQYDLSKCLDGLQLPKSRPRVVLQADDIASSLTVTFAFGVAEGHVGEDLPSQLIIKSRAHKNSAPIVLSEVRLVTSGSPMDIMITHDGSTQSIVAAKNGPDQLHHVLVHEALPINVEASPSKCTTSKSGRSMSGSGDLSFVPGTAKAFTLNFVPREAGDSKMVSATLCIRAQLFDMDVMVPFHDRSSSEEWWLERNTGIAKKKLPSKLGIVVKILPKPPKMNIGLPDLRRTYYTDEHVAISVHIVNEEDEEANVTLDKVPMAIEQGPRVKFSIRKAAISLRTI
ncbi:Foie gras liver health family 1 [Lasallia pustulata]|uniref:Foie gras liver health family 1 n=1 Tax=Lasallia pustulata TaxID=136370 RepID=A0A1W5D3E4_9LECA|nr:Foie gras liver health family 1 [Lasallia pustulata]